eukprot:gb/GECH01012601.1/.p1 GENE.gb/GECH01012601.1/~~gb/GECH01012601.1/.p1  ORF type:complete len:543 (+),score=136.20 gb/GECH01012601.1/:1-1629(+)
MLRLRSSYSGKNHQQHRHLTTSLQTVPFGLHGSFLGSNASISASQFFSKGSSSSVKKYFSSSSSLSARKTSVLHGDETAMEPNSLKTQLSHHKYPNNNNTNESLSNMNSSSLKSSTSISPLSTRSLIQSGLQRRFESTSASSGETTSREQQQQEQRHKLPPHESPFNIKAARTLILSSSIFGALTALSGLGAAGVLPLAGLWMASFSGLMTGLSALTAMFLGFGATQSDRAHLYSSSVAALVSITSFASQFMLFIPFHIRAYLLLAQTISFAILMAVVFAKRPQLRSLKKDVSEYVKTGELVKDVGRFALFSKHAVRQRLYGVESVTYHQADVDYCYWNTRDNVPLERMVRPDFALKLVCNKLEELGKIPKGYNYMDHLRAYDLWEITSLKRDKKAYFITGVKKETDEGLKHEIRGELEIDNQFVTFFAEKHISTAAPLPEGSQPVTLTRYDDEHEEDLTLSYRNPEKPGLTTVDVVEDALNQMEGYTFKVLLCEDKSESKDERRISAPLSTPGRRVYEQFSVQRGRYKSLPNLVAQSQTKP